MALAAIEYVIAQRVMKQCRATLPAEQIHTVTYSRLCADPVAVLRKATDFCGLTWTAGFERSVKLVPLVNHDDKWRSSLTVNQQAVLKRTLDRANVLHD